MIAREISIGELYPAIRCGVACLISPHGGNPVSATQQSCLPSRGRLPEIVRVT